MHEAGARPPLRSEVAASAGKDPATPQASSPAHPVALAGTALLPATPRPPTNSEVRTVDRPESSQRRVDPEASIEIPPPAKVERSKPGAANPLPDPYIGTTFDHRYKIEKLLGEGGMGHVYLARHKVIDKKVAIKVLRSDMAHDREILDRFLQEAKAASSIGNPHIVDISDFGDLPDGSTYFVMEFLEGKSLAEATAERFDVMRICSVGLQLADGLEAAHEQGIVHRDLKPDNIFLVTRGAEKDFVKILDFGIAKVSNSANNTNLTKAGSVFGTPHYMSPEQAAGAPIDHRTDIYSLGIILYEMASGKLPFNAENFMGILTKHMYEAPVPIRALIPAPDCPPGLEALILKCLSKKPDSRYGSMRDLAEDLEKLKRGEVPSAVQEMMARSGGFNVPHDFFKTAKAIVPATPAIPRTPWPRYVWLAGALTAMALVTAIIVKGGKSDALPKPKPSGGESAAAIAPVPSGAASAGLAKKTTTVAFAIQEPDTAVAYRDGQALKLPAMIDVEDGKLVHVEVRAEGFQTASIDLDGKETSKLVRLTPLIKTDSPAPKSGGASRNGGPPKPGGKQSGGLSKSTGGSEVVDPWK